MNICPNCFKPLAESWHQPGDFFTCERCGEFLTLRDSWAVSVATPDEVIEATRTRLAVLLKSRIRVLKQFCGRVPVELTNQTHQTKGTK